MATRARTRRKRDLVKKCTIAREGGNRALVDFHVTPPLGSSMSLGGRSAAAELVQCTSAVREDCVSGATMARCRQVVAQMAKVVVVVLAKGNDGRRIVDYIKGDGSRCRD